MLTVTITSAAIFRAVAPGANQVVIVAPGLNNSAQAMQPLVQTLNAHGYDCLCVPLRFGQRLTSDAVANDWIAAISDAYAVCCADYASGRIHAVAYSLGALVT